jgi:hypothetical protein
MPETARCRSYHGLRQAQPPRPQPFHELPERPAAPAARMTARQNTAPAAVKPVQQAIYRTGHCQTGHHSYCPGTVARVDCCSTCHRTCPCCGQEVPRA